MSASSRDEDRARRSYFRWLAAALVPVGIAGIAALIMALAFRPEPSPERATVPAAPPAPSTLRNLPLGQVQVVGTIFGVVGSGALSGATVRLWNDAQPALVVATDQRGNFAFPAIQTKVLDAGPLQLYVTAPGMGYYYTQDLEPYDGERVDMKIGLPTEGRGVMGRFNLRQ